MAGRRRWNARRRSWNYADEPITIRVGTRRSPQKYHEIQVTGPRDAPRFARLVDDQVRAHPRDPLVISVNNHQPWLGEVLSSCIEDYWDDISELNRELQFAGTAQFPEKASKKGQYVPWTFVVDEINVPQVYYWSVGLEPPARDDVGLPFIEHYRLRVGVWFCGRGACKFDRQVSTTLVFTRPTPVSEHVVSQLLFDFLYKDEDFSQPREDEEGICWNFSRLYWLFTDWQNVIREVMARLDEAELNSHGKNLSVKLRTRAMHSEIDRIYDLKEYLRFHSRSFKKLQKLKQSVPKEEQQDPLWDDMDDAVDDLDQFDSTLDSLKERFNNLLDLEFNISNADQADDSSFLSIVATIFLPVSFLASIFGISSVNWPVTWYVYAAVPVFVASAAFLVFFSWFTREWQKYRYPMDSRHITLRPGDFTMLGSELPDSVDVPGGDRLGRLKNRAQKHAIGEPVDERMARSRSRNRSRSRARSRAEKNGY